MNVWTCKPFRIERSTHTKAIFSVSVLYLSFPKNNSPEVTADWLEKWIEALTLKIIRWHNEIQQNNTSIVAIIVSIDWLCYLTVNVFEVQANYHNYTICGTHELNILTKPYASIAIHIPKIRTNDIYKVTYMDYDHHSMMCW